MFKKII